MGDNETLVQGIQLAEATERATAQGPSTTIYSLSILMVTIAFIVGLIGEQQKTIAGEKPNFLQPVKSMVFFIIMLSFYGVIATKLVALIKAFGTLEGAGQSGSVFLQRAEVFWKSLSKPKSYEDMDLFSQGAFAYLTVLFNEIFMIASGFTFVFTSAVIWSLKIIQHVMTSVLISLGPFIISLAAFAGPTRRLLAGWFMAIIEVTSWGVVAAVLNRHMNSGWGHIDTALESHQNPFEHMIYNLLYAFAYAMIPVITSVVIRGSSAAGLGPSTHAIKGAALMAGGLAYGASKGALKMVSGAAVGAGSAAAGAAGGAAAGAATGAAASKATSRAGDAASPRRAAIARDASIKKQNRERDS